MASPKPPLWQALREALEERGLSVRRASRDLHAFDGRQSEASWKRTLNKALDEDSAYTFTDETADILERFLAKPAGHFVRPQQRETMAEENRRLRDENSELRRRLGDDEGSSSVPA